MSKVKQIHPNGGSNKLLVTHTDLDGMSCAVIFLKCYPKGSIMFCDYTDVNEQVNALLDENDQDWDIMITDISVDETTAERLDKRGKVALVDHHNTAKWLADKYYWAIVDNTYCATKLFYNIMSDGFHLSDYAEYVDLVDNWDRWGNGEGPSGQAIEMNFIAQFVGINRFVKARVQSPEFLEIEKNISPILLEKYNDYYDDTIKIAEVFTYNHKLTEGDFEGEVLPYQAAIVPCDQYQSLIGNRMLNDFPELEFIMMIDSRKGTASLRGKGNIDLGKLAKTMDGGGHPRAAGMPLGWKAKEFIGTLEEVAEGE